MGRGGRALRLIPLACAIGCLSDVNPRDDDEGGVVAAPAVDGEPRADHRTPSWIWTVPDGATGFRARIDGGDWTELDLDTTWLTAPSALEDGEHLFEVQARDAAGLAGPAGSFATTVAPVVRDGDDVWRQDRTMATSPLGHPCAVWPGPGADLDAVHAALDADADLVEVDTSDLAAVLADPALEDGDQVVMLALADTSDAAVRAVLDALAADRAHFARAGRHVVLRASADQRAALDLAHQLLDTRDYLLLRPYVRTAVTFERAQATRAAVIDAADRGDDLVDVDYRTAELMSLRALAHARGLGVAVHGVPEVSGEVFIAVLRDTVDAVAGPVADARAIVEREDALFFVDPSAEQDETADSLSYQGDGGDSRLLAVNHDNQPLLRVGQMDDAMPGGRLVFDPAAARRGSLHDADAPPGGGILVAVSARFAQTELPDDSIMTMLAKSEHSGWALDLENPAGDEPTVMRFSVHVDGAYHYTTVPTAGLRNDRAYLIIGAYDGDGEVGLWIDNDDTGVDAVSASGDILNNDYPVLIGGDPGDVYRYFFAGEIDLAVGQSWAPL